MMCDYIWTKTEQKALKKGRKNQENISEIGKEEKEPERKWWKYKTDK